MERLSKTRQIVLSKESLIHRDGQSKERMIGRVSLFYLVFPDAQKISTVNS